MIYLKVHKKPTKYNSGKIIEYTNEIICMKKKIAKTIL